VQQQHRLSPSIDLNYRQSGKVWRSSRRGALNRSSDRENDSRLSLRFLSRLLRTSGRGMTDLCGRHIRALQVSVLTGEVFGGPSSRPDQHRPPGGAH
jgi:hypothetical protein